MLTANQIENSDYGVNDVADLLMRIQIASNSLSFIVEALGNAGNSNCFVKDAHRVALNTWGQIQHSHDCEVERSDDGFYRCKCGLIATAD